MNIISAINNQKGASLIEAMIAIFVLTVGIMAAMLMQTRAIGSSSSALNRTDANNVAISLLETLKQLPFNDANLAATSTTLIVTPGGNPVLDGNERTFAAGAFPEMQSLIQVPAGAPAGTVVDRAGVTYQLSWDVQDRTLPGALGGGTIEKVIRVYMTWNSLMGQNQLDMTTVKYRNISL